MKKTLKLMALSLALGVAGATCAFAEQVKVGFAAEPYPPFTSPDASGNWEGWEVDFEKAICTEAKLDCVITPVAWDGHYHRFDVDHRGAREDNRFFRQVL
jgi:polar amino acid transport system substrate-binding protein